jgi:colanic acid biosynthesis glycosyl transferase WcaI
MLPTMKILFLTHYFAPDVTSNAVIATEVAERLVEHGHTVTVITSVPHYDTQAIPPDYQGVFVRRITRMEERLRIWYTWLYVPHNKRSTMQRFLSYISYNLLALLLIPFMGRYDVVYTMSPPLTNGIIAFIASLFSRAPYIYGVQDLFPDLPVEMGLIKNQRLINLLYALERLVYAKAAMVKVLTEDMRQKVVSKGVPEDKLAVIPDFIDTDFVAPLPRDNAWATQHKLVDKYVVMYTGNIGSVQSIEVLVDAAPLLADIEMLQIAIVGDGAVKADLVRRAEKLNATNILFLPVQPRDAVPNLFASADALLVSLRKEVSEHSVPSKMYTIMASGRPVLASIKPGSPVAQIVEAADCGYVVPPEDPTALAAAIRELVHNPEAGRAKGTNGRRYVVEHFSAQAVVEQYHQLMTQVAEKLFAGQ